jgi:DNA helicase-2/ATP-dependent DNA helicase PcrA
MRADEQTEFRRSIAADIADWAGEAQRCADPWWPAVERIPDYFDGLARLAAPEELDDHQRRVVHRVVKYLVSPLDLMPEFIYGPVGFREDLALIADAVKTLAEELGAPLLRSCGLPLDDPVLVQVRQRAESDLDDDVRYHLRLLLDADSVAGDEELSQRLSLTKSEDTEHHAAPHPHTMVFAGPGTGKTYCLETELYRLLIDEAVPPGNILVTTFTNKAADELRVRIRRRLQDQPGSLDLDRTLQQLTISTIHAFCFRIIVEFHHHALFLKGALAPMDETQRMLLLFRHGIGQLKLKDIFPSWQADQRQAPGWRPTDLFHFYDYVGRVYDFLSEDVVKGAEPGLRHRYLQIVQEDRDDRDGSVLERIIHAYPRYWRLVQDEGFLDHSMLLAYAEALMDDPEVRTRVQARFRHLLVDEYQDTNPIQDRIFRAVAGHGGCMFAVGDDDQSIYAFRGADVRNATEFPLRWPGATLKRMEENRRSTATLVDTAQTLIRHNVTRQPKELFTRNPTGVAPWRLTAARDDLPRQLAALLLRLKTAGAIARWSEVALLFRGLTERVAHYRQALHDVGIDNVLAGDRRFLRRPVIKSLMSTLGMIRDDESKLTPRKRVHRPFFEAVGCSDRAAMLEQIRTWNRGLREERYDSLLALFYAILNDTDALASDELLSDLGHLSSFIATAEAQLTSPDLLKRLGYFLRYAEAADSSFAGPQPPTEDAVQIMTIHKSKGLEFPVVVVADAFEGALPAFFAENLREKLGHELAGLEPHLDPVEEERRVLYVAMTRAERYLILATTPDSPSRFLDEFPSEEVPDSVPTADLKPFYVRSSHEAAPLHMRHSEVYNYHFCPRRYLLADRCGFAGQVIAPLRAGLSLHRALEIYHRLKRDGEDVSADRRRRIFERAWVRPRKSNKAQKEFDQLHGVFEQYAGRWEEEYRAGRARVIETEMPFYTAQGAGVLTGKIDLVREHDDRLEIVELKYHENAMLKDYPNRQLEQYSLAFPRERPRLVVNYLREDKEREVRGRDAQSIRDELAYTFEDVRRLRFAANPGVERCRLCPVRFACVERAAA